MDNKVKKMKRYQKIYVVIVQSLLIISLLSVINNTKFYLGINKNGSMLIVISNLMILSTLIYTINKFWKLKGNIMYKLFSVLDGLYSINIIINGVRMIWFPKIINIPVSESIVVLIFLIINLVLILTYNRNAQVLENKVN